MCCSHFRNICCFPPAHKIKSEFLPWPGLAFLSSLISLQLPHSTSVTSLNTEYAYMALRLCLCWSPCQGGLFLPFFAWQTWVSVISAPVCKICHSTLLIPLLYHSTWYSVWLFRCLSTFLWGCELLGMVILVYSSLHHHLTVLGNLTLNTALK